MGEPCQGVIERSGPRSLWQKFGRNTTAHTTSVCDTHNEGPNPVVFVVDNQLGEYDSDFWDIAERSGGGHRLRRGRRGGMQIKRPPVGGERCCSLYTTRVETVSNFSEHEFGAELKRLKPLEEWLEVWLTFDIARDCSHAEVGVDGDNCECSSIHDT